jgi:DNA uptake protein ComE-like DNA-binding protein
VAPENQSGFSVRAPAETSRPRETPGASPGIPSSTPKSIRSHPKEKTPLGKIDINTATEKELTTVPGIGHVMAARIIAARPFRSADDLRRVSGIGDKKYTLIRPYFQ